MENVGKMLRLVDECTDNEAIMFICRFEIVKGKIEELKHHAHQAMKDIVSFNILYDDPTTCHTVELYRNSRAAMTHILNMQNSQHAVDCITEIANINMLEVHGQVSKSLKAL